MEGQPIPKAVTRESPVDLPVPPALTASPTAKPPNSSKGYETINSILLTEPRIEAMRRELQMLLQLVQLESGGEPVEIDGFRLRNAKHWADYPTSLSEIFWHLSSVCNFSCEFCYEKGNPPDFPIQNTPRMASPAEIETRLRHYEPLHGKGIFAVRTAINEPFANKNAIEYLKQMRARSPGELISFVTNGAYLDRDRVAELSRLQPLFFNLSIYSTDPGIRLRILRDFRDERAVQAIRYLKEFEVAYMSNVVMWPTIPLEDLERTVSYLDDHNATVVRVCLGGYSAYLRGSFPRFDPREYWPKVVAEVERLRLLYSIPILIEPNSYVRRDTDAQIDGVVVNSPAARAGMRRGDLILSVNGTPIESRVELLTLLRRSTNGTYVPPGIRPNLNGAEGGAPATVTLAVQREQERFTVTLDRHEAESMKSFPYSKIAGFHDFAYGLVITDTLRYSSLKAIRSIIVENKIQEALLLTSEMIEPLLHFMLQKSNAFADLNVNIRVARNHYFGGSINIGDLLVVQDFIDAIGEYAAEGGRPIDAVLLPASPFASSPWGRDLTGRPWRDIERVTGIPVYLFPCPNITF